MTKTEERINRYIEKSCLMNDSFFELFFSKDKKYIEFVICEIFRQIGKPLVEVVSVLTQLNIKTIGGINPRLDLLAVDKDGRKINIEVQQVVGKDLKFRSRFYCAVIDANSLPKGGSYKDLPETYVIFITKTDAWGQGLPAYVVERSFMHDGTPFNDGSTIIFVNGEYRGDDPIGRLMNDFSAVRAENMKNKILAEGMKFFKETEIGRKELSGLDAEIFEEGFEKGQEKLILAMLRKGFSFHFIATSCDYPEQRVKELKDRFIEEGLLST